MTFVTTNPLRPFVGREDIFAQQNPNGSYFPVRRPLEDADLREHLTGGASYGTYTLIPDEDYEKFYVKYVVFDLDTGDEDIDDLCEMVNDLVDDPTAMEQDYLLLERSGGKGYHIWLFLDEPIEAYRARAWVEENFTQRWLDAKGYPIEVFPKQDRLAVGGLGNLVKLPLGVHARTGNRSEVVPYGLWATELGSVRGYPTKGIPKYDDRKPTKVAAITAETPTGILTGEGPVSRFLRGEIGQGERNFAFHAFFTWTAWNLHLPNDLAWDWCLRLNDALDTPEADEASINATMESAYSRPPADAAEPRQARRSTAPASDDGYRAKPLAERLREARLAKEGG